ncbi:MAG: hypothetical protein MUE44_36480 [Oscillatoriaceae cyanobacterium Prado104]|jgi:hypothetical protein|nr:hypothetical protein [Oscillatoriaceae cyanobacterium Prado104]
MQTVETLHREAMELVDRAVLARQHGDIERSRSPNPPLLKNARQRI